MWGTLRHLREYNPAFVSTARDLAQATSRSLIVALGGIYVLVHLGVTVNLPAELSWPMWPLRRSGREGWR